MLSFLSAGSSTASAPPLFSPFAAPQRAGQFPIALPAIRGHQSSSFLSPPPSSATPFILPSSTLLTSRISPPPSFCFSLASPPISSGANALPFDPFGVRRSTPTPVWAQPPLFHRPS